MCLFIFYYRLLSHFVITELTRTFLLSYPINPSLALSFTPSHSLSLIPPLSPPPSPFRALPIFSTPVTPEPPLPPKFSFMRCRRAAVKKEANKARPNEREAPDAAPGLVEEMMDYWDRFFKSQVKTLHEVWQKEVAARIELQVDWNRRSRWRCTKRRSSESFVP